MTSAFKSLHGTNNSLPAAGQGLALFAKLSLRCCERGWECQSPVNAHYISSLKTSTVNDSSLYLLNSSLFQDGIQRHGAHGFFKRCLKSI